MILSSPFECSFVASCRPQYKSHKASFKNSALYLSFWIQLNVRSWLLLKLFILTEIIFLSFSPAHSCTFFRSQVRCYFLQNIFCEPYDCIAYPCMHSLKTLYSLITQSYNCHLCFVSFSKYCIFPNFVPRHLAECLKHGTCSTHNCQIITVRTI